MPADEPGEESRSVRTPTSRPGRVADEDRIAGPGALDGPHAVGQRRARQDGHGLAPAEHAQALLGDGRDAARDGGFGDVGHGPSVVPRARSGPARWRSRDRLATRRPTDGRSPLLASRGMDRRRLSGIGLVVVAAAGFASGSIFATLGYGEGLDWLTLSGLALPDRGRPGLGVGRAVAVAAASVRAPVAPAARGDAGAWASCTSANSGTYYAGIETIPASLAGVIVYIYPAFVPCCRFGSPRGCRAGGRGSRSSSR